ncbi:tRNA pseudouridine(54/55) synthase Pus10 [Halosimplex pelagicum]|uniref:tRNA pseudouridine synthase Pus10 n=1 Tax=Halosimplex pelagicum TaxID=869886 RepID=A0A7D5T405_9EURY|nr:tRNA pseudouridine(54/55) synthase Pus10 [Halosimplex pelagicum]QLH81168.1 tRNA pseudouridine(54/55) synthase Pus10 [Halosimplex pelagicum]
MTDDVLDLARRAVETGPLCDPCLGRLVAERSFGLTNRERGRSLRVAVALADDRPVADLEPDEPCWVCEGESTEERAQEWAERAAYAVEEYDFETFQVGTRVPPLFEENDALLREDLGLDDDAGEALKTELNREVGKRFGRETDSEVEFQRPDVQVTLNLGDDTVDTQVNSAFVYGRYRKLERDIPQTKWPCSDCNGTGLNRGEICEGCDGSGYRYDESVEQLTAPVVEEAMDGESATFHGAGREDVDALMLEGGRPFVIEIDEPRQRTVDAAALEPEINEFADGKVEVLDLRQATYEMVERVKELDASKTYRMEVEFEEPVDAADFEAALDELAGATVEQRTPQRVDHRRADIERTREVYDIEGELDDERTATVELHGEGGLYVKELVSSDEGRTEPSLAGLLDVDAVVTALDVLNVEGEDEPFADEEFFRDEPAEAVDGEAGGDGGENDGSEASDGGGGDDPDAESASANGGD